MYLSGAKILVESLKSQGVDVLFGYPGGNVIDIYDELSKSEGIRNILVAHEQGAAHAADGYARSTGKVGVVLATSGPGATNLVTGLSTAHMDSTPIVAITGNVPIPMLGKDSFQEIDITGLTVPVTKHNFLVRTTKEIPEIIQKAFEIASSGRPGPVLVDIPKDLQQAVAEYLPKEHFTRKVNTSINKSEMELAAEYINASKKPVLYFGGGIKSANAKEELREFSNKIDSPMASSTMGMSTFAYNAPRFLGLLGMHGRPVCNFAISEADLVIAIGARFSDRIIGDKSKFASNAKIIHVDLDSSELGKNMNVDLAIQGDAKTVLSELIKLVEPKKLPEWNQYLLNYKAKVDIPESTPHDHVDPRLVIKAVSKITDYKALVATDVGQHQMLVAQNYRFTEDSAFISSCGLGTMGFGMGAANGTQVGNPDKRVVLFTGDGSFHMNMHEFTVAVTENLPIVVIIMNNSVLGMVRQWQKLFYGENYASTIPNRKTDFVKLAEAFGATGLKIESNDQIDEVLQKAFDLNAPVIVECIVDKDHLVLPFIPAGKSFADTILKEEDPA